MLQHDPVQIELPRGSILHRRYRLERRLEERGSNVLYLARDRLRATHVALSVRAFASDGTFAATLDDRLEITRLRGQLHPHLAELLDVGWTSVGAARAVYHAERIVDGVSLRTFARGRSFSEVQPCLREALEGLAFLHRLGLEHRAFTLDNVVVADDGAATLVDLSSCTARSSRTVVDRQRAPAFDGSLPSDDVVVRSDLHAVGAALTELTTITSHVDRNILSLIERLTCTEHEALASSIAEVLEALGVAALDVATPLPFPQRIIGRELQLTALLEAVDALLAHRPAPRVLTLRGPSGAGRTRLLQEVKWHAQQSCIVLEGDGRLPDAVRTLLAHASNEDEPAESLSSALEKIDALLASRTPVVLLLDDADALTCEERELWDILVRRITDDGRILVMEVDPASRPDRTRIIDVPSLTAREVEDWATEWQLATTDAVRLTEGRPRDLALLLRMIARTAPKDHEKLLRMRTFSDVRSSAFRALSAEDREYLGLLGVLDGSIDAELARGLGIDRGRTAALFDAGWLVTDSRGVRLPRMTDTDLLSAALDAETARALHLRVAVALKKLGAAVGPTTGSAARHTASTVVHLALGQRLSDAEQLFLAGSQLRESYPRAWIGAARRLALVSASSDVLLECASLFEAAARPRDALQALATLLRGRPPSRVRREAHLRGASAYLAAGEPMRALRQVHRARKFGPDNARLAARMFDLESRAHLRCGAYEEAQRAALAGLERASDDAAADLHDDAGLAATYLGENETARQHLRRAAAMHAARGDRRAQARSTSYQALVEYRDGKAIDAAEHYERALDLAERCSAPDLIAHAALNLAVTRHQLGDLGDALPRYERALTLMEAVGKKNVEAAIHSNIAKLYVDIGAFQRADAIATRAQWLAEERGDVLISAASVAVRGEARLGLGDRDEAATFFEEARLAYVRSGAKREACEATLQSAEVATTAGALQRASQLLDEIRADIERLASADLDARFHLAQGHLALRRGSRNAALALLEVAYTAAARSKQRLLTAEIEVARATASATPEPYIVHARELWERASLKLTTDLTTAFWQHPARSVVRASREARRDADREGRAAEREKLLGIVTLGKHLCGATGADEILGPTLDCALPLASAERGLAIVVSGAGASPELETLVTRNLSARPDVLAAKAIAMDVLRAGEGFVTADLDVDPRLFGRTTLHALRGHSILCVPLREPGTRSVVGAIYLDCPARTHCFSEFDWVAANALAEQVSALVTHARALAEATRRAEAAARERRDVEELANTRLAQIERLERAARDRSPHGREPDHVDVVRGSAAMQAVFAKVERLKHADVDILIEGASGTGKELVARALHAKSSRARGPFAAINCAALPDQLLESELFGHVRGSFTGALRDHDGLFVRARGGTVFLDEVGDMPPAMQVRLLRVLQQREVQPVGGSSVVSVDVRVIAATHRNLRAEVAHGRFREDLFYRLAVVEIALPLLKDRVEDIPELAARIVQRVAQKTRRAAPRIEASAIRVLAAQSWPGNVRELENVLTKATLFAEGDAIGASDLAPHLSRGSSMTDTASREDLAREEAERMLAALREARWNVSRAAKSIDMPRPSFYRKLRRYGLGRQT